MAEWMEFQRQFFGTREFESWFAKMVPLVESGSREFYNVINFDAVAKPKPKQRAGSQTARTRGAGASRQRRGRR
ncbi:MAG: hypothetical protein EXR67_06045 [Dehalococcoidia bacterium]|nr:hypothetical protein [Dehalococcoidia bacterium]